ncbi:sensor histidine kinase [Streptomyces spiramyceticus]|uniref:sensor histidine kinase n=1 Tax=Streptomyces spiramyceticus TaxID=299717 RepID=UPI00237C47D4|nr:histidine kinase [Streptomyces spiramyceticus]
MRNPVVARLLPLLPLLTLLGPVALAATDALLVNGLAPGTPLAVSLAAAAALLLRRRFPVAVLLATLPGMYVGYVWFAPMIALYTVASRRPDRRLLPFCGLLVAAAHFLPNPLSDLSDLKLDRETVQYAVDTVLTTTAPVALGLLVRTRRELAARLAELAGSRAREDRLLAGQVLATERARLAREMHDVVAHQVSLISLQAGALGVSSAEGPVREVSGTIRTLAVRTLDELRHMVGVLRAAGGDTEELTPQPRLADLPRLVADSALDVEIDLGECLSRADSPRARIPEAVERAAFRIVQEALTNVRKHAPGARVRVRVRLRDEDSRELHVEVRNGPADRAAAPLGLPGGGHGLVGLHERVQLLGGAFEAGPTGDAGFLVRAVLPSAAP